jgi:hypothetical protein
MTEKVQGYEGQVEPATDRDMDEATGRRDERGLEGAHRAQASVAPIAPLFSDDSLESNRERWRDIQQAFVDEPQEAVREADTLVSEIMDTVAKSFAEQRQNLERQWGSGSDVSTEDLRRALQQYRSFFERLLAA